MTTVAPEPERQPPVAVWLVASWALGRPVPVDEPYPHICRRVVAGRKTGQMVALTRKDCVACQTPTPHRAPSPAPLVERKGQSRMELRPHQQALLRNALEYAARGWAVFPLRVDDKRPAFPDHDADGCAGADPRCQAAETHVGWEARATTDPDRIRRGWSTHPYNIGIACGPSGLVVVDLDTRKPGKQPPEAWRIDGVNDGQDVFALICQRAGQPDPTETFTVATGRGGRHRFFRQPDWPPLRNTTGEHGNGLGWLVDTRAHGGYVVAAGSIVNGKPYTVVNDVDPIVLPDWLATRLRPAPLPAQRPVVVELGSGRRAAYLDAAIRSSLDAIATAGRNDNDTLNTTLFGASVALGQLVAGGALDDADTEALLLRAAVAAGHPAGSARRTIRSGFRTGAKRPRSVAA